MESILNNLNIPAYWHNLIVLAPWLIAIWLLSRFVKKRITKATIENENQYKIKKAVTFAAYLLFQIVTSVIYSSKLGGFTVALGVAGAGIAFALQEVIASFAGWLALLFGNFYKPGDRVQLGGIKGD